MPALVGERGKHASASLKKAEKEATQLRENLQQAQKANSCDDEAASTSCTVLLEEVKATLAELNEEKLQAKARSVLRGLGLKREQFEAPTSSLSGGWRMRVALAKAFLWNLQF